MGSIETAVQRGLARQAAAELEALGATRPEINLLLGIAWAESNLDGSATGPAGEAGLWQIEKEKVDISVQAQNALRQLREIFDTLALFQKQPWYQVLVDDWRGRSEVVRAAWQLGKTGPARAVRYWLEGKDRNDAYSVKRRWDTIDVRDKLPGEKDEDAKIRKLTAGGKLGALDLITYAEKALGADGAALRRGLATFRDKMSRAQWDMLAWSGYKGVGAEAKDSGGAAEQPDDTSRYGWLANTIRNLFAGVRGGLKVLVGEAATSVLPAILLVLGAGAGVAYIRRLWQLGSRGR
jgi:hypothetical protein